MQHYIEYMVHKAYTCVYKESLLYVRVCCALRWKSSFTIDFQLKVVFTHLNHCAALLLLLLLQLLLLGVVGLINAVVIVAVLVCVCVYISVCLVYLHAIFYGRTLGTLSICTPLFVFSSCFPPYSSAAFVPCPPIGWTVCLFAIGLVLRLQNCNRCLSH